MSYSQDFREKVIEIMIREQFSICKTAKHFNLSTQTVRLWKKSIVRKPITGRPPKISPKQILADVAMYPEDYMYEKADYQFNRRD